MKRLTLDRKKIDEVINDLGKKYDVSCSPKANDLYIYKFRPSGVAPASLNIYFINDGTTTIHYKTGANQVLSEEIAREIVDRCSIKQFKSNSFYLKSIRDEDFDTVIEFLSESNEIESDKTDSKNHRTIRVKGHQGDTITIHRHSNGSFQVQGRPRMVFNDVIYILSELLPFKDIIDSQLEFYETNLTTADILGELEARIPIAWEHIDDKIKSILSPCIALAKVDSQFDDYSFFAFPALRALEGVMKQIFKDNGILIVSSKNGFGDYILNRGRKIIFTDLAEEKITCLKTQKVICNMYAFYSAHRHSIFHVDGTITNTRVLTYQDARNIIDSCIDLIDDGYAKILN